MRRLAVGAATDAEALESALSVPSPVLLELRAAPAGTRLPIVLAAARASALVIVSFEGTLASPLAEIALLAHAAEYGDGAALDLEGALLSPLVSRLGAAGARRLLARGTLVDAALVLPRFRGDAGRSAAALAILAPLLSARGDSRAALARERAAFALVMTAGDRAEGIRAFRERRPPRFDW